VGRARGGKRRCLPAIIIVLAAQVNGFEGLPGREWGAGVVPQLKCKPIACMQNNTQENAVSERCHPSNTQKCPTNLNTNHKLIQ
jgi:hypothetical protein